MSYSVTDSINGKAIGITYAAAQLALPTSVSGRARSKVVRQHLASHQAKHALVVRNESDTEVWWAGSSAGLSFASAIENWLVEQDETVTSFRVVIPLDTSIYIASVDELLVSDERLLSTGKAEMELKDCLDAGTVIYAYEGGTLQSVVQRFVPLEPLPFSLFEHSFAPAWLVFAKNAMVHPLHLVGVGAVVGLFLFISASGPHVERLARQAWNLALAYLPFAQDDPLISRGPPTILVPNVDHSGAQQLRKLANAVGEAEVLYRDGLGKLTYASGSITLSGHSEYPWPETARAYSIAKDGSWSYNSSGWSIGYSMAMDSNRRQPNIEVEDTISHLLGQVGFTLTAGPETITGPADRVQNTVVQTLYRTTYQAELGSWSVGALLDSASQIENLPVSLSSANCQFSDWQIQKCQLTFEVRTL